MKGLFHGGLAIRIGLELEAGDLAIADAAGDNPFEVAKVCRYVKREAVRGYALRDMNSNGGDLFFADTASGHGPDTGELTDALGHHAEVAAGSDQSFFEEANVVHGAEVWAFFSGKIATQIEDGIPDELTWAVVGNVSTAIDLVQFHPALCEQFVADQDVGAMRIATERKHRRMFQQEQRVVDKVLLPCSDD